MGPGRGPERNSSFGHCASGRVHVLNQLHQGSSVALLVSLPEWVVLMFLGCRVSLAVRSVGRPTPSTRKVELGAVAAGAQCRPLSLREAGEREEVLGKTSWRRQSWRWRGREGLSRGSHFSLPSPRLHQPGDTLQTQGQEERSGMPPLPGDLSPWGRVNIRNKVTGRVKGKRRDLPKGGTCVSKTLKTRTGMDTLKTQPQGHKVASGSGLPESLQPGAQRQSHEHELGHRAPGLGQAAILSFSSWGMGTGCIGQGQGLFRDKTRTIQGEGWTGTRN